MEEAIFYNKINKSRTFAVITPIKNFQSKDLFFIKPEMKYNYIKHRLDYLRQPFLDTLNLDNFHDVNYISSKSFYTYGVITHPTQEKSIKSVYLMSNIDKSNNFLIRLKLDLVKQFSIFPGQVVAIKGKNTCGSELVVEHICPFPVIEKCEVEASEVLKFNNIYERKKLRINIVNGPFLENNNILDNVLKDDPDVLILCGPFIDTPQDCISPKKFFNSLNQRLESYLRKSMESKIIIIPSTNDITSYGLYPQCSMAIGNERIVYLSNPSIFQINEIYFAVSTLDTFLDLATEEIFVENSKPAGDEFMEWLFSEDRIWRLCAHSIFQRCFIPVFPIKEPVDYSDPGIFDIDVAPHVFITTSKLKEFQKTIEPTKVINLGMQSNLEFKCMAKIEIGPIIKDEDGEYNTYSQDRIKVEFVKIN